MEDPRCARAEELDSLSTLVDTVFAPTRPGTMFASFPTLFTPHNLENLLVCADRGRIVSHVGMEINDAALAGCRIRVACIGAVATYEECRGQGLATRLFKMACDKAHADGVDFMLISGGRGLYLRAGAAHVGHEAAGSVEVESLRRLVAQDAAVRPFQQSDLPFWAQAYERKAAHFVRTSQWWNAVIAGRRCMCDHVDLWTITGADGTPAAYCIASKAKNPEECRIFEFAGSDTAVAQGFALVASAHGCQRFTVRLQREDHGLKALLEEAGAHLESKPAIGTLLLINFPQLMERLRPALGERIREAQETLTFSEDGETFRFDDGQALISLERAAAAQMIFGTPEGIPRHGVWQEVFPLPGLCYGLNYI